MVYLNFDLTLSDLFSSHAYKAIWGWKIKTRHVLRSLLVWFFALNTRDFLIILDYWNSFGVDSLWFQSICLLLLCWFKKNGGNRHEKCIISHVRTDSLNSSFPLEQVDIFELLHEVFYTGQIPAWDVDWIVSLRFYLLSKHM